MKEFLRFIKKIRKAYRTTKIKQEENLQKFKEQNCDELLIKNYQQSLKTTTEVLDVLDVIIERGEKDIKMDRELSRL